MSEDDIRRLALEVEHQMISNNYNASFARAAFIAVLECARYGDDAGWLVLISDEIAAVTP